MRKVIIKENKWRSGSDGENKLGKGGTQLRNEKGYMCCLGFACHQLGDVKYKDLIRQSTPESLNIIIKGLSKKSSGILPTKNTELSDKAMRINDDEHLSLSERKIRLKRLFKRYNIQLVFKKS